MDNNQRDLFHSPASFTELNQCREQVCLLVSDITRGRSRDRIADEMTRIGHPTSKLMIDAWASPSREAHNIPFYQVPALEFACDQTLLTDWDVALHGGIAWYGEEALRREIAAELADMESQRAIFTARIHKLRKAMRRT